MQLSDGERLILWMLAELHKHHEVNQGEDGQFVQDVISRGHFWALKWRYTGILGAEPDAEGHVTEVCDILDMWSMIEWAVSKKSLAELTSLSKATGDRLKFPGFDGNNEAEHLGIASFLVEKMERFQSFKGRDLNSHHPTLDRYRRMHRVFEPKRSDLGTRNLSADEIIEIFEAGDRR